MSGPHARPGDGSPGGAARRPELEPDFERAPLVAAIAQEATTKDVLMVAWMDREAWDRTVETGYAHYHSRSRGRLWKKGETSGNVQRVREIRVDCDEDAVLMLVDQTGPACHTGNRTCFYREGFRPVTSSRNP